MLPARWGAWVEARPERLARLDRWVNAGRRIRTRRSAGLRDAASPRRAARLPPAHPCATRSRWRIWNAGWTAPLAARVRDYDLAVEILRCRRLIKGYSDTHARGLTKFDKVMEGADAGGRPRRCRRLGRAGCARRRLQDDEGKTLDGALETIRSFA